MLESKKYYINGGINNMGKVKDFVLNKLESMFPNYMKLGDSCLAKKKYKDAIAYYEKALAVQAKNPYFYYNWAAALYALGQYKEAISKFKRAVRIKPDFADAFCHWGLTLVNMKQPHQAHSKFKMAIKYNPTDPKAYFHWAFLFDNLDKLEEAEKRYNKVLELTKDLNEESPNMYRIMALNQLAINDFRKVNFPAAMQKYTELVKLDPEFGPAHYNLAIASSKCQKYDLAEQSLLKAVEIDLKVAKRIRLEPAFEPLLARPEIQKLLPKQ